MGGANFFAPAGLVHFALYPLLAPWASLLRRYLLPFTAITLLYVVSASSGKYCRYMWYIR